VVLTDKKSREVKVLLSKRIIRVWDSARVI